MGKHNDNITNAFAASLSFGFMDKEVKFLVEAEDAFIEKKAGIVIYQPTVENIEDFLRKYILNELTVYNKKVEVGINIKPDTFNMSKPEYVDEGSGTVFLTVNNNGEKVNLELPFLIHEGELIPFDVIQMGKQRVPYNRDNLKKIITGIEEKRKPLSPVQEFEPYKKLEKLVNPSSSTGFMNDVIKIREQQSFRNTQGGNIYVSAEVKIDECLEKLASMSPVTEEDFKALESSIRDLVVERERELLEKEAAEVKKTDDTKMATIFQKVSDIPFVNAYSLPHGTIVAFPMVTGKEATMEKGIIIDKYLPIAKDAPKKVKILLSAHGKMKILESGEKFLCVKTPGTGFHLPYSNFENLDQRDVFVAFDGDKAFTPSVVKWKNETIVEPFKSDTPSYNTVAFASDKVQSTALGRLTLRKYEVDPITSDNKMMALFADNGKDRGEEIFNGAEIRINILEGANFAEYPYNEFIKKRAEQLGLEPMRLAQFLPVGSVAIRKRATMDTYRPKGDTVLCTDEKTKVVIIKGIITGFLKDKKDLENLVTSSNEIELYKSASVSYSGTEVLNKLLETFEKTASEEIDDIFGISKEASVTHEQIKTINFLQKQLENEKMPQDKKDKINQMLEFKKGLMLDRIVSSSGRTGGLLGAIAGGVGAHAIGNKLPVTALSALGGFAAGRMVGKSIGKGRAENLKHSSTDFDEMEKEADEICEELERLARDNSDFANELFGISEPLQKVAAENYVEIRSADKEAGTYNVVVSYADKTKKDFKMVNRRFNKMPYNSVRELLKAIGFGIPKVGETMQKARSLNYVKIEIPEGATPEKISGGQMTAPVTQAMKKVKNTLFDSHISDVLASEVIGSVLAGALTTGAGLGVASHLRKMATEAESLSIAFEKVAREKKSAQMLKVAKLMAVASHLNDKVEKVASGRAQYFKLNEVVSNIMEATPHLEKVASDLVYLKVQQIANDNEIVNRCYIESAVNQLDHMYKVAYHLNKVAENKKNKPDEAYDKTQLKMGEKVEKEHGGDKEKAKNTAKDHLDEMPNYYTKLKKMESQGKKD
jgi:hypothetical protein